MRRVYLRLAIVTVAAAALAIPVPPAAIERLYSGSAYPRLQHLLTAASNRAAFALLDLLIAVTAVLWIALAWRDLRRATTRWRGAGRIAARSGAWCAALYLAFLAAWGLNYRRVPLHDKLPYDDSKVTAAAAIGAARATIDRLNALHAPAHAAGWPAADAIDPALADGLARAARDVRLPASMVPARPKWTMLDWYFRRSGTGGMTDPFFLETLVASNLLPFERPFIVAHEWSHLAGVNDEGEANFVGWLACMRGGTGAQYSGSLFLYGELAAAVPARDRAALAAAVGPGPREDLREMRARNQRDVNPRLSAAGWRVYDSYLRANRVEAGAASYAEVVKLVLGLGLDQDPLGRATVRAR